MDQQQIRNFSIIAHIDHGKTTLSDRLLEVTGALQLREMRAQFLDSMDLERERGITIKSHPVRLHYKAQDGKEYILNLLDTPGHVDFSYEVSRSLASCEGACLLVDASQGVEAQTMANAYLAMDQNLAIIPVINKIDLPNANLDSCVHQIMQILPVHENEIILASGKEGIGITDMLEAVVKLVPPPTGDENKPLAALIFDSIYDAYRGVVVYFRIFDGTVRKGERVSMMATGHEYEVLEVGVFTPKMEAV